jgi:S1-C subfamily serine protease
MKVTTLADLYSALEDNSPGEQIEIGLVRNEKELQLKVTLADREEVLNQ